MSIRIDTWIARVFRGILTGEARGTVHQIQPYYSNHRQQRGKVFALDVDFELFEDEERRLPVDVRALARIIGGDVPDRHTVAEMVERVSVELMAIAEDLRKGPTEEERIAEVRLRMAADEIRRTW